jgi:hypothetical protein
VAVPPSPPSAEGDREIRDLIRRMSTENARWGSLKTHGELLKLGFVISERTVVGYLKRVRHRGDPAKRWPAFLGFIERRSLPSTSSPCLPTFQLLYCFFVVEHGRRRMLHFNGSDFRVGCATVAESLS